VVVLAVSTVLLGQSRARIERERQATELARQAAEAARGRAQAINDFLVHDLLGQADPERNPAGADVTVRQVLDRAAKSLTASESKGLRQPIEAMAGDVAAGSPAASESTALEPDVEGAVRSTIGNAYLELGLYQEAATQLSKAVILLRQAGAPKEDVIFAQNREIWAKAMRGSVDGREAIRALEESEMQLGREHPETVYAADTWAQLYKQNPKATTVLRENLEIQRRRLGNDHQLALRAASQLVIALSYSQADADRAEAESLARENC
jgi:hypothetical protein